MESYLSKGFQRVVLNGQTSSWIPIFAGVPQRSILRPLLFLCMYIKDIPKGLKGNIKLFAGDTYLFCIVKNKNDSANDIYHELSLISNEFSCGKCFLTRTLLNLHKK